MSNLLTARNGFATVLSISTIGSSGLFTDIAGLTDIKMPKKSLGVIDVTYHDAPDAYDVSLPGGIIKMDQVTMTGIMITCSSFFANSLIKLEDLREIASSGDRIGWKITVGGPTSKHIFYGDGYITEFGYNAPFNEKVMFTCAVSPTGKPFGPLDSTT